MRHSNLTFWVVAVALLGFGQVFRAHGRDLTVVNSTIERSERSAIKGFARLISVESVEHSVGAGPSGRLHPVHRTGEAGERHGRRHQRVQESVRKYPSRTCVRCPTRGSK